MPDDTAGATLADWERLEAAVRDVVNTIDGRDVGVSAQGRLVDLSGPSYRRPRTPPRTLPATSAEVCPRGCHVAVAHHPFNVCPSCEQSIPSGAVGIATWFGTQPHRCIEGGRNFQHGCGTWNSPEQVPVEVRDLVDEDAVTAARRDAPAEAHDLHDDEALMGDAADRLFGDALRGLAEELVAGALAELHDQVSIRLEERVQQLRGKLLRDLVAAYDNLERIAIDLLDGGFDLDPGTILRLMDAQPAFADESLIAEAAAPAADLYGSAEAAQEELLRRIADSDKGVTTGADDTPGVVIDLHAPGGPNLVAWDYDPRDRTEHTDIIQVTHADVEDVPGA